MTPTSKLEFNRIQQQFQLNAGILEEEKKLCKHIFFISTLSKWLNEEESNQAIVPYSYFSEMSPSQIKEFFVYENKLINFFKVLYQQTEIFAGCYETETEEYYYFETLESFLSFIKIYIRRETGAFIIIPKLWLIIEFNFDFTYKVYEFKKCKSFIEIVQQAGLFILQQTND